MMNINQNSVLSEAKNCTYGNQVAGIDTAVTKFANEYAPHDLTEDWDIVLLDSGMPVLKVPTIDGARYLTPFRGYRFQMSGTVNGSGDYGASEVATDMYKLAKMGDLGYKALEAFAIIAIHKAGGRVPLKAQEAFCVFMSLSVAYLRTNEDHIKQCYGVA